MIGPYVALLRDEAIQEARQRASEGLDYHSSIDLEHACDMVLWQLGGGEPEFSWLGLINVDLDLELRHIRNQALIDIAEVGILYAFGVALGRVAVELKQRIKQ